MAETTAPATESTILAGSQVTFRRIARPIAPARIWPSRAPARTTTSAANTRVTLPPSIRSATGWDSCAPITAPPRKPTIEVAETRRPCRKPERANSRARAISTRSTTDIAIPARPRALSGARGQPVRRRSRSPCHRHGAGLPQLRVERARERIVAGLGDLELDRHLLLGGQEVDAAVERSRKPVVEL